MTTAAPVVIRLLHVPDCPHVGQVRAMLNACLESSGVSAVIDEAIGDHPSPTLIIDGVDVVTRRPPTGGAPCCRLDLPTESQIAAALEGHHGP